MGTGARQMKAVLDIHRPLYQLGARVALLGMLLTSVGPGAWARAIELGWARALDEEFMAFLGGSSGGGPGPGGGPPSTAAPSPLDAAYPSTDRNTSAKE